MIRLGLILMILTGAILAKPVVTTSILPTAFFVERIGGNDIEVNSIVRANADPHSFEPKVSDMKKLTEIYKKYKIIFRNKFKGVSFYEIKN